MNDASPAALASTLPPPPYALSDLEQDAVLAVTLGAELAAEAVIKVCSCGREHTEVPGDSRNGSPMSPMRSRLEASSLRGG